MTWVEHGGYYETHQYVDEMGRIVATVRGSKHERDAGWTAFDETTRSVVHLGRYVELAQAKKAVEERYRNLKSTEQTNASIERGRG